MTCNLSKLKKITATHYVSSLGNEYPIHDYTNHGRGGIYREKLDLPHDEYPFTIKYSVEYKFLCCKICECVDKEKLL
jgi:hypothetical protein